MTTQQYTRLQASDVSVANLNKLRSTLSFTISDNLRFHKQLSLERLSYLALGDGLLNQFEINPKKALNFLLDPQTGLLVIGKILTPIEVGVVYADADVECQADLPEVTEDEIDNEFVFTVSGRHRITGLLTWANVNGIDPKDVMVPVTVSYYQTWEDGALSVLAANGSRTMTPTEKLNVTKQSQQIDTQDFQQLANSVDSSKHAKEAFILTVASPSVAEKLGLQRNTIASVARAFLKHLSGKKHKGVLTWFSNVEVLTTVGKLFVEGLADVLKTTSQTNIARYATSIGKAVFESVEAGNLEESLLWCGVSLQQQQQQKLGEPQQDVEQVIIETQHSEPQQDVGQVIIETQHETQQDVEVLEDGHQHQNIEQTSEPTTDAGVSEPDEDLF